MTILRSISELRDWRRSLGRSDRLGFTPTMGALHDGHLEHLRRLEPLVDLRLCSIYVNPTQFAPEEDHARYPRDLARDAALLEEVGCDALFFPDDRAMYPEGYATWVMVEGLADRFEGEHRPAHFRGVTTIVCKLLNLVRPDVATFGQKDAQQLRLIERMVEDLNLAVEIVPIPIVRDPDGLAMSSRNRYLSEGERSRALSLGRALRAAREVLAGGGSRDEAERVMRQRIDPGVELDYCTIIDRQTFDEPTDRSRELLGIVAARVGATRLIDNMMLTSD